MPFPAAILSALPAVKGLIGGKGGGGGGGLPFDPLSILGGNEGGAAAPANSSASGLASGPRIKQNSPFTFISGGGGGAVGGGLGSLVLVGGLVVVAILALKR